MPRFFVGQDQIENDIITIVGDDAHHISRSLRMAVGDTITLCDMNGNDHECQLISFADSCVRAKIISSHPVTSEPPFRAYLFQALPKGDKLDLIIQKSVECGVFEITTFNSERCIAKERSNEENKLKRRQRIALEAAKQSGRGKVPKVNPTVSFDEMIKMTSSCDIKLFCYEKATTATLRSALSKYISNSSKENVPNIAIIIGSEGGFSAGEAIKAREEGMTEIGLGSRILRTETASSFVLGCLVYEFEL